MKRTVRYVERDGSYTDVEEEVPAEEAAAILAALQEEDETQAVTSADTPETE